MTGSSLTALTLRLAFSSNYVTALLEPWLAPPGKSLEARPFTLLPIVCSKCAAKLGEVEGGWIKPGPCRHCPSRPNVPFDAMLAMAFSLLGSSLTEWEILAYLASHPIDPTIVREVEKRQPILYKQAPVTPTHKLINIDGLLEAILSEP